DQVDADIALALDHVRHSRAQFAQVSRFIGKIPLRPLLVERDKVLGPRQAARMAGQNPVRHLSSLRLFRLLATLPALSMPPSPWCAQYGFPLARAAVRDARGDWRASGWSI